MNFTSSDKISQSISVITIWLASESNKHLIFFVKKLYSKGYFYPDYREFNQIFLSMLQIFHFD